MTSVAAPAVPAVAVRSTIWPLARIEAKRYARHPVFLIGLLLGIVFSAGEHGPIELDYQVIPSFFIGVLGLVLATRLTTSTGRSRPVVDAAPVSETMRTAALCLACVVPAAAGVVLVLVHRAVRPRRPLPGVDVRHVRPVGAVRHHHDHPGHRLRGWPAARGRGRALAALPGAALLAVVVILFWSNVAAYVPAQGMNSRSLFARFLHMATAYTAFGTSNGDGNTPTTTVRSYTGSPLWFAVWALALCGLAATAALWRRADGRARTVVGRTFVALVAVALVALTLSVATGNQRLYDTSRGGTVSVALSALRSA